MSKLLDGSALAKKIRSNLKLQTEEYIEKYNIVPHLAVILVGADPASETYVRFKEKACNQVGIKSTIINLPETILEEDLIKEIHKLNNDDLVHGILLQLPIPKHLDSEKIINLINPKKDVDGFANENVAKLSKNQDALVPCTPLGIIRLLEEYEIKVQGEHCVILGRSQIVGKPMAQLMLQKNSTVTICHSKTKNLKEIAKQADILIAAIGNAHMVDDTYVKEGAVVIDVGVSRIDGKIYGDVDFDKVIDKVSYITPMPGGTGPMTIACLLENTLKCYINLVK
ncbi:MAG: bifunctional methylenetetrahydrofolate dehydrogenase/methenyltetrahydrofolate cyclohydrolase FolD [Candidatus Izemoplasmatales bacterium]|jgi:methylenetetrahydrofolate dehydrogenase (NADP+)/methenyltetrahydrofolate cyclohydrolase|nr:bifunctional methylenetetrahydrofolate dehydrogenase/methenyltetrahydrofolate cyclohydrolase FolD [Candidatus Izemoplasmatales bacterium]